MAIKRVVDTAFWTDGKVDDFSPEDKYFMLWLLTNPFCRQLGIYEMSVKQSAFQMGYSVETVKVFLDRFENKYGMIRFSPETNEVAIVNFLRHSVMKGGKPVEDCILQDISRVKNRSLIDFVFSKLYGREDLNVTVRKIIDDYVSVHGLHNDNDIHNDNDNDNDRTGDESSTNRPTAPKKAVSKAEINAFFESLWKLYPVKKGKQQVSDAKRRALFKIGLDEMKRAIDRYLKELEKDASWRKPQNGSTFFNSGYVDYLDANFEPSVQTSAAVVKPGEIRVPARAKSNAEWMRRMLEQDEAEPPKTAGEDPEVKARADALKARLGGK